MEHNRARPAISHDYTKASRVSSNLGIPTVDDFPRIPSPRVEDMMRSPRKAQRTRQRLPQYQTFDDAVKLLKSSQNIVVLTGAGISTSVGIPDFRSDKGLYNKLSKIGITQPEDFFSMSYFQDNPEDFFKYVREVVPTAVPVADGTYKSVLSSSDSKNGTAGVTEVPKFTPTHAFLALLQTKGKLLTNYTQNIDGLERAAGLPNGQYVQCHGSWDTATCLTCRKSSSAKKYLPVVHSGNVPFCKCFNERATVPVQQKRKKVVTKTGRKRKRANSFSDHSSDDGTKPPEPPRGLLKPDLVFFEEKITPLYHSRLESDRPKIDLLIIIGTSLKVAPIQYMLFEIRPDVPQIYISKERFSGALCSLPGVQVDIELLGECDMIIEELCRRAEWTESLSDLLWSPGQTKIKQIKTHAKVESIEPKQHIQNTDGAQDQVKGIHADIKSVETQHKASSQSNTETDPQHMKGTQTILPERSIGAAVGITQPTPVKNEHETSVAKQQQSKVKVELVEGTDHQWRITRTR